MFADEVGPRAFHECVGLFQETYVVVDLAYEPGYSGLAGSGIAGEHEIHRVSAVGGRQTALPALVPDGHQIGHDPDFLLYGIQSDQFVEFFQAVLQSFLVYGKGPEIFRKQCPQIFVSDRLHIGGQSFRLTLYGSVEEPP